MSNSKFEYVKSFEIQNELLKNTYIVIRIDGKGFTKFTDNHGFVKPNDLRGIKLMILAATQVVQTFNEIFLAYGQSDEFSFAFRKDSKLYNRRGEKILTYLVSTFTSAYVFHFNKVFDIALKTLPTFDGRIILYPDFQNLKDYFSWRQVDCHINNLYNTTFWALVNDGNLSKDQAHAKLKGTFSKDKNEILFNQFGINYNNLDPVYKRGTLIGRKEEIKIKKNDEKKGKKEKLEEKETKDEISIKSENKIEIDLGLEKLKIEETPLSIMYLLEKCDKLLSSDEEFIKIIKEVTQDDKSIFISHEDVIQNEFWQSYFPQI
jgi:tRNA(His) guanylyltransferase